MFAYLIYVGKFLTEVYVLYVPMHLFVLFGLVRDFTRLAFSFDILECNMSRSGGTVCE